MGRMRDSRKPHALHSERCPSGPRRHSGVSLVPQEVHFWGGAARFWECTGVNVASEISESDWG
jgi:hypothetical protein